MDASRKQPRKEPHRTVRKVRIFAASASDTAAQRAKVAAAAAALKPLAGHIGVAFDVVDWGAVVPDMGRPKTAYEQLHYRDSPKTRELVERLKKKLGGR